VIAASAATALGATHHADPNHPSQLTQTRRRNTHHDHHQHHRLGNMATAIGTRAAQHRHTIEAISRNTAKAQALADQIGKGATAATFGATPVGDIPALGVTLSLMFAKSWTGLTEPHPFRAWFAP
jgi:hypothetical protein